MQDLNKLQEEIDSLNQSLEIIKKCKDSSVLSYTCLGLNMAIKELDSQIEKLKENKPWPQVGDLYYYLDSDEVLCDHWDGGKLDENRRHGLGIYNEGTKAQFYLEKFMLMREIDDWEKLNNPEGWDWNQEEICGLDLDNINNEKELISICYHETIPNFGKLATHELAEQFFKEFRDRILKYLVKGV